MPKLTARDIATASLIAALYTVLSLVFMPISFGVYQVRIAEALTVLPFLTPAAIPGLYIGCLLANILGGMGWLDILIGPLITLVAALLTRWSRKLIKTDAKRWVSFLPIILAWIGSIYVLSALRFGGRAFLGCGLSLIAGVGIAWSARFVRPREFQWQQFLSVVIPAIVFSFASIWSLYSFGENHRFVLGFLLLWASSGILLPAVLAKLIFGTVLFVTYLVSVWVVAYLWFNGEHPNLVFAPLPPVVLNAFGVSAYLAPLIGVGYWFSVQMVGIGQIVACFGIGLPLLLLLQRRKVF